MLKGQEARLYYTVWSLATGEPVAGDLSQYTHTVYYSGGSAWTQLSAVQITEIGDGVYTFILPAAYTNVDTAVCRVESSNEGVIIPPLALDFNSISEADQTLLVNNMLNAPVDSETTLGEALQETLSKTETIQASVSGIKSKIDLYPDPSNFPTKADIPTADQIATSVLTTNIPNTAGAYSVGAMVLGGFCSDLDPDTNTWTIRNSDTTVLTTKTFVTSTEMGPIVSVR